MTARAFAVEHRGAVWRLCRKRNRAQKSGDAYDAKSGFGLWANPLPESGQGPAVGSVTFTNLQFSNNFRDIENQTSTFTITRN